MMNKELLIETQTFNYHPLIIQEAKISSRGNVIVEGLLATAEIKNGNGRYYKKPIWERELDKYASCINENRALGELDHPDSQVINLKNASHNILKAWWEGDNIMGKIEILPTPSGNILKTLIENNIKIGVSSRGMGSLKEVDGLLEVQEDFELLCWDFVSTPSNPGSWMGASKSGLNEGLTQSYSTYQNVNLIITNILCNMGKCPI
jgi:hypothetical protein